MPKERLDWFPFYGQDFFGDEKVLLMTNAQIGIYLRLLVHQWDEGSIPGLSSCYRILQLGDETDPLREEAEAVFHHCFIEHKELPGRFINARMSRIDKQQRLYLAKQRRNGKLGGRPKAVGIPLDSETQRLTHGKANTNPPKTKIELDLDLDLKRERKERIPELSSLNNGGAETRLPSAEDALDGLIRQSFGRMPA